MLGGRLPRVDAVDVCPDRLRVADRAFVLVDRSRQAAREGRVYVVTDHAGDWSVNRVVLEGRRWVLASDRAGVPHTAWRPGLELSGEVLWVSAAAD